MPEIGTVLIALIGTGGLGAIIGAWAAARKTTAEADVTVGEAWSAMAQRHEAEIACLKEEMLALRKEVNVLREERTDLLVKVTTLTTQLERERETSAALRCEVDTLKGRVRELEGKRL